jgi:hypothetical protein
VLKDATTDEFLEVVRDDEAEQPAARHVRQRVHAELQTCKPDERRVR